MVKTARQIVLDLKGKVTITEEDSESLLQVDVNNNEQSQVVKAMLALEALGYSKRELSRLKKC